MASSPGTQPPGRWASHDIFLFRYHFLFHILRFLFFFSDKITADVASKQQTTALCLSTIATRTRHTELTTKKNWQTWWETCAVPENIQFSFSCSFLHSLTWCFSDRASRNDYILITNLMHWLLFIYKILFSSTCFEPQVLIFRRIHLYTCSIWYCQSLWEFLVACRYTAWVRTDCRGKVVGRAS